MATPPTFVAEYEAVWNNSTSPKTVSVTTAVGDLLVVCAVVADNLALNTPTGGTSLSWTATSSNTANNCRVYIWRATATTAETFTMSISEGSAFNQFWGFTVYRFSGSDGFGAVPTPAVGSGGPSLSITTTADNSAIVAIIGDWAAVDGTTRTWRTVNSIIPTSGNGLERSYARDASWYTIYSAYWNDAGALGGKTVGVSAPVGQTYAIAAIEIKGAAGGGSNSGTLTASTPSTTASISGTQTDPGTVSANTPPTTASVSGQSVNPATLAAATLLATAAITGTVINPGTLAAATPVPTASITGTQVNSGTLSASMPRATASIADQTSANNGTLSASVPVLTATASGTATDPGTLAASTPVLTSTLAGSATNAGTLSASVPRLTAAISDTTSVTGTLSAKVPNLTATITGQASNPATLAANLPRLTSTETGTSANPGATAATLPLVVGTLVGTSRNPGTLAGALPGLTAHVVDFIPITPPERTRIHPAENRVHVVPPENRTHVVPFEKRERP